MSVLKSSPTLRWEHRETDENEMLASERTSTDSLLENCCGLTELTCAVRWEYTSSSLGRASDTDMRNMKAILRYPRGNPGIMTVRPTTVNLEELLWAQC